MVEKRLSVSDVENLSYYDFMGFVGVSFFSIGGPVSTIKLAKHCGVGKDSNILEVGCGTGFNACQIAKEFGCRVTGVDIAEVSVQRAVERAVREGLSDKVGFRVADAYKLPFADESFDVVYTSFVSQFLDMKKALAEFRRVLKSGGVAGINEMYKDAEIPAEPATEISEAEDILREITGLPFKLRTPAEWSQIFQDAGFANVEVRMSQEYVGIKDSLQVIRELGGFGALIKTLFKTSKYALQSKVIRSRFAKLQKTKVTFMRKKSTAKHVGYVLATGKK
ncbi:MAG: methyltransferase domain-containing protein [Candidatus Altiarchaeota archaeon]